MKKIISCILAALIAFSLAVTAFAENYNEPYVLVGGFSYVKYDDSVYFPFFFNSESVMDLKPRELDDAEKTIFNLRLYYDDSKLDFENAQPSKLLYESGGSVSVTDTGILTEPDEWENTVYADFTVTVTSNDILMSEEVLFDLKFTPQVDSFVNGGFFQTLLYVWGTVSVDGCEAAEAYSVESKYFVFDTDIKEEDLLKEYRNYTPFTSSVPHEHTWSSWNVINTPTTLNEGMEERTCKCGEKETREIAKLSPITIRLDDNQKVYYKKTVNLEKEISNPDGVNYSVKWSSSNEENVKIDYGEATGLNFGRAKITCTVTDEFGNVTKDTCTVRVRYSFLQWITEVFLFGWIWY